MKKVLKSRGRWIKVRKKTGCGDKIKSRLGDVTYCFYLMTSSFIEFRYFMYKLDVQGTSFTPCKSVLISPSNLVGLTRDVGRKRWNDSRTPSTRGRFPGERKPEDDLKTDTLTSTRTEGRTPQRRPTDTRNWLPVSRQVVGREISKSFGEKGGWGRPDPTITPTGILGHGKKWVWSVYLGILWEEFNGSYAQNSQKTTLGPTRLVLGMNLYLYPLVQPHRGIDGNK